MKSEEWKKYYSEWLERNKKVKQKHA